MSAEKINKIDAFRKVYVFGKNNLLLFLTNTFVLRFHLGQIYASLKFLCGEVIDESVAPRAPGLGGPPQTCKYCIKISSFKINVYTVVLKHKGSKTGLQPY